MIHVKMDLELHMDLQAKDAFILLRDQFHHQLNPEVLSNSKQMISHPILLFLPRFLGYILIER